jgi:type IV pilus secretin PilQ/predicted competence protein
MGQYTVRFFLSLTIAGMLPLGAVRNAIIETAAAEAELDSESDSSIRSVAPARPTLRVSSSSSPIAIRSFSDRNEVSISTRNAVPRFVVQELNNPSRLVVDIENERLPSGASLQAPGSAHIAGVRVGAHPTKTRVVIDLKGAQQVTHRATTGDHSVVVAILPKDSTRTVAAKAQSGTANADSTPLEVAQQKIAREGSSLRLDEDVVASGSSTETKTLASLEALPVKPALKTDARAQPKIEQITVVSTARIDAKDANVQAQPKVEQVTAEQVTSARPVKADKAVVVPGVKDPSVIESVSIEGQGKYPSLVVGVKGEATYSIDRTAPSEYVLTVRNTIAQDALLKQTLFTSKESTGIRSVRTTVSGENTLVRIFTQPSSFLTVQRNGDKLVVQETQDLAQIARDIRAQMAPPSVTEQKDAADQKDQGDKKAQAASVTPAAAAPSVATPQAQPVEVAAKKAEAVKKEPETVVATKNPPSTQRSEGELAAIRGNSMSYTGRLISLDLQDADIDSALRIIAEVSNLNIVAGDGVVGKVTLKLVDVPWDQALDVILKNHGLDKVLEGNVLRVAPVDRLKQERESFKQARVAEEELEPLSVKYMRVSYAKASEIKALVETVLTERGTVAFDERSNQLVVKDVRKGLQNVAELIRKVDLRTPQILLETQIIEASRNLSRKLGSELGFQYIQSPATGNGTGLNFPSAIALGGSVDPTNSNSITGSAFPIATSATAGSAITMLFDSADGTKSLALRLSQLEQEGQVRIISKPAVATTNNKPAEIKSVEKYRVKLPNGGLSIATGSGAQSTGAGNVATQTIEAGIVLNVTPQASPDYYILLDIQAKSSSFGSRTVEEIPNEIERSASSSVLVSSGQTFALGGIYKITERDSVSGVPFFKDIPVLGTFFRSATTENSDEELLFFITPRIVEGSFEDAGMKMVS